METLSASGDWQPFEKGKNYEAFLIKRKSKFVRAMANEKKNNKPSKKSVEIMDSEKIASYSKSSYFQEKDRKAIEFLKKHPVPSKLLK